ncbi:hypothetical protein D910_01157 [Dendroctonus ponderosae]|uniref:Chitin-binding type-2 domain-containing protein n=1 Tax=Dendroctonus ponderosae TaxID=77166 RepID=U4TVB2_DENPD|nr:hypothetical protein D910_01157 [Dendroctonus ponderosae]
MVEILAQDDNESDDPTSEELCLNRPADEYFRLSTEGDCRDVVRLASVRCPVGLAFDVDRQTCDWKTNVKNCDKLERSILTYRCTKSGLKQITCPSGLAFDIDKQTCDWKGKVTNCDKLESKSSHSWRSAVKEPAKRVKMVRVGF